MSNFSISDTIDPTIDFIKKNYEFLIPFTILYFLIQILAGFIDNNIANLILQLAFLPLAFSIQYFTHISTSMGQSKYKFFFDIYNHFFKYLGAKLISGIIIVLLLLPAILSVFQILENYDFDTEKLLLEIKNKSIILPKSTSMLMTISVILVLLSLPFTLFIEYFAIIKEENLLESLKQSYAIGQHYYIKILLILLISMGVTFLCLLTCGFGFLVGLPFIYIFNYFAFIKMTNH